MEMPKIPLLQTKTVNSLAEANKGSNYVIREVPFQFVISLATFVPST